MKTEINFYKDEQNEINQSDDDFECSILHNINASKYV